MSISENKWKSETRKCKRQKGFIYYGTSRQAANVRSLARIVRSSEVDAWMDDETTVGLRTLIEKPHVKTSGLPLKGSCVRYY